MDGGNDSIVDIPLSNSLKTTDKKLTVMAWAYLDGWNHVDILGHSYPFVFFGFHNEASGGNPTKRAFKWQVATSSQDADRATIFAEDNTMVLHKWYHLAGTYDGATVILYIDGQPYSGYTLSFSQVLPMPNVPFTISGFHDPTTNAITDEINGQIDDVRLYNRALSASEILDIYNATK